MAKEKFLLVSLKEEKSKKLAQVLANDTSRQILDFLADREATESELAEALNLPLSTVHYNLQALMDAGLIIAEEFHYSEKGKEVMHYKLANKYIIIAPKTIFGVKEKLKAILPTILIIGVVALIIQFFLRITTKGAELAIQAPQVMERAAAPAEIVQEAVVQKAALIEEAAMDQVANATQAVSVSVQKGLFISDVVIWFVAGAAFSLAIYLIIDWLRKRKQI